MKEVGYMVDPQIIPSRIFTDFQKQGIYGFMLNETTYLYIGQSSYSMLERITDHMTVMCNEADDKWWGISREDLASEKLRISISVIDDKAYDQQTREEKERKYIRKHKPLLQTPMNPNEQPTNDECISREDRIKVISRFKRGISSS